MSKNTKIFSDDIETWKNMGNFLFIFTAENEIKFNSKYKKLIPSY